MKKNSIYSKKAVFAITYALIVMNMFFFGMEPVGIIHALVVAADVCAVKYYRDMKDKEYLHQALGVRLLQRMFPSNCVFSDILSAE